MKEVKMNFLKKSNEEEMYNNIVKMLLEKGYKPLNNITYHYSFDCKNTTISNDPYSITINYKLAA